MANWREKINLNTVINEMSEKHDLTCFEDKCPDEVKTAIAAELRKSTILQQFAARIERCESIAAVNRTLKRVFDTADRELVWCGTA